MNPLDTLTEPGDSVLYDADDTAWQLTNTRIYLSGLAQEYTRNHADEIGGWD